MSFPSTTRDVSVRNVALKQIGSLSRLNNSDVLCTYTTAPFENAPIIIGTEVVGIYLYDDITVETMSFKFNILKHPYYRVKQITAGQHITVYRDGVTYDYNTGEGTHFYLAGMNGCLFFEAFSFPDADDLIMGDERECIIHELLCPFKKRYVDTKGFVGRTSWSSFDAP